MEYVDLPGDQWRTCERHCRQFEAAWHDREGPAIEDHLPGADSGMRDTVLGELVLIDLEFRLRRGLAARVEEYLQRFPQLEQNQERVLTLIEEEYALRLQTEHNLSPAEYAARFPPLATELEHRLSSVRTAPTSIGNPARCQITAGAPPVLPGCEILDLLGRGGMGVVYKAHHIALDRIVAVKLLRAGVGADTEERNRFQTETRAAALLQHPNIVQIYDVGNIDGQPYCLLEFVAGGSLQSMLAAGPIAARLAAQILEPLARAIHCAHQRGIIHRDLKPGNILLKLKGDRWHDENDSVPFVPKITDFGLAKRIDGNRSLTETGTILGTAQYMAPEQAAGQAIGPSADVYSLGAILYEMITGRPPFQGASPLDTIDMLRNVDPVAPSRLQAKLPRDLETICLKCLHKEPGRRYGSAAELADDLKRFQAGEAIVARPVGAVERSIRWCRRKPAQALLVVAVALIIVGAASAAFVHQHQQAKAQAEELSREADARRKREVAAQQVTDALTQGRHNHDKLRTELAAPGGVFQLLNEPARWEAQVTAARAALDRAQVIAAGVDGALDAELHNQVTALARQLDQDDADRALALGLEKIRLDRSTWSEDGFDSVSAEREYLRAFVAAGLGFSNDGRSPSTPAAANVQRIQTSPIREQLLASLDDWAYVAWTCGNETKAADLLEAARLVDPHAWRDRVRSLTAWRNPRRLEELANQALADPTLFEASSPQMLHLMGVLLASTDAMQARDPKKARSGAPQRAEAWLRLAQHRHMRDFWLNFQLALLLRPTEPTEAAGFYRTALVLRPHSGAAWNNYGVILRAQKNQNEAVRAFRKAIDCEPRNAKALANLAISLHEQADFVGAVDLFQKATEIDPRRASTWYNLGNSLSAQGKQAAALDAYRSAVAIDPGHARAWNNIGNALRRQKDLSGALKAYQHAVDQDPNYALARSGLSAVYLDQKNWPAAVEASRKAVELDSKNAIAWMRLGRALREQRELPGAIEAFEKSLEIEPKNAQRWRDLGVVRRDHKDSRAAAEAFKKSVELNPRDAYCWGVLGIVLDDLRDARGAVDAYRRALKLNPGSSVNWNNLGVTLRRQNELVAAAEALEKSIALNPKVVNAYYQLVQVYRDQGRFNDAMKTIERGTAVLSLFDSVQLTALQFEVGNLIVQEKHLAAVLAGEKVTPAERVALADFCQRYQPRYRDAVRLYASAFADQPQLAGDLKRGYRLRAACAAVRAADATVPDVAERGRLRGMALAWLRADLDAWTKSSDAAVARKWLAAWRNDPDLASVRESASIAMLPAAEQDVWRHLWSDVQKFEKETARTTP